MPELRSDCCDQLESDDHEIIESFAYAALHTGVYLERKWGAGLIVEEGLDAPLGTGWLALFVLLILALTSNGLSVGILRERWKRSLLKFKSNFRSKVTREAS